MYMYMYIYIYIYTYIFYIYMHTHIQLALFHHALSPNPSVRMLPLEVSEIILCAWLYEAAEDTYFTTESSEVAPV